MKELNEMELREVDGGWLMLVACYLAGVVTSGLVGELITEGVSKCYDNFMTGLHDR